MLLREDSIMFKILRNVSALTIFSPRWMYTYTRLNKCEFSRIKLTQRKGAWKALTYRVRFLSLAVECSDPATFWSNHLYVYKTNIYLYAYLKKKLPNKSTFTVSMAYSQRTVVYGQFGFWS